jgi:Skp family chaperone for outer membrane proteins
MNFIKGMLSMNRFWLFGGMLALGLVLTTPTLLLASENTEAPVEPSVAVDDVDHLQRHVERIKKAVETEIEAPRQRGGARPRSERTEEERRRVEEFQKRITEMSQDIQRNRGRVTTMTATRSESTTPTLTLDTVTTSTAN